MDKLESRAALYSTLAFTFAYPEQGMDFAPIALEMEEALALAEQAGAKLDASALRANLNHLHSAVRQLPSFEINPAEEHTYLFQRQALTSPYESSHSSAGMEQSLADIAGFYRAFGVQMSPEAHERVDHIGSELEFMAVLCAKESRAANNGMIEQAQICRDARHSFLSDHLGEWVLAFVARVHEKARLPLYPALADTLATLLAFEAEELGVVLKPVDGVEEVVPEATGGDELSCD